MKMMDVGSFDYLWTLKKTLTDGSTKYSQVKGIEDQNMSNTIQYNCLPFYIASNVSRLSLATLGAVAATSGINWRLSLNLVT